MTVRGIISWGLFLICNHSIHEVWGRTALSFLLIFLGFCLIYMAWNPNWERVSGMDVLHHIEQADVRWPPRFIYIYIYIWLKQCVYICIFMCGKVSVRKLVIRNKNLCLGFTQSCSVWYTWCSPYGTNWSLVFNFQLTPDGKKPKIK